MARARLALLSLLLLLPACASDEPINGCAIAAAKYRNEVVRAKHFAGPTIPARILGTRFAGQNTGHALLVYRLDTGWWVYDDTFGSRRLHVPATAAFPDPLAAARLALPGAEVTGAAWID